MDLGGDFGWSFDGLSMKMKLHLYIFRTKSLN